MKLAQVHLYLPAATKLWLEREAAKQGLGLSAFIRSQMMQLEQRSKA